MDCLPHAGRRRAQPLAALALEARSGASPWCWVVSIVFARYSHAHGTWILLVAPAIGCFVAATFVASFIAYLERSERDTMQHIFARHVSADVVDTLWEARDQFLEGGRLKPQRLTCTVMFTDLKGFSTISEGMEPAELMNWMNEYMDAVARHVDLHDGVVNSYIGDAIMALFGAPVAHTLEADIDRDAVNAVKCALAMRGEMEKLNEGWTARGMPNVAMRIGIYTGPLVAGSLGSADRLMFTVLGDTTNTAARLEGAGKELAVNEYTKLCTILIGEATLRRLGDRFVTEYVGPMSLKGKANQIIVHSVLYAKPRRRRVEFPRLRTPSPRSPHETACPARRHRSALRLRPRPGSRPTGEARRAAPRPRPPLPRPRRRSARSSNTPPPKARRPAGRIDGDGGSRGTSDKEKLPALYVLVPDQAALTTHEAPTLFWYQTGGANTRFELTLTEPKNPKPLLKLATDKSEKSGIHRVSLAKQNVTLKPGVTYKWTVAWVPKADNRSLNVVAGGSIQRVEPDPKLATELEGAPLLDQAGVFAQNGIWYDALESLSNAIEAAPEDKESAADAGGSARAGWVESGGFGGAEVGENPSLPRAKAGLSRLRSVALHSWTEMLSRRRRALPFSRSDGSRNRSVDRWLIEISTRNDRARILEASPSGTADRDHHRGRAHGAIPLNVPVRERT